MRDASEVDPNFLGQAPSGLFQDSVDHLGLYGINDTTQVLHDLWNRSRMDAQESWAPFKSRRCILGDSIRRRLPP